MVKIRLTRIGSKKRAFYRVMAIDERKQRDGRPLQYLGTYDPRINPAALNLDLDGIEAWLGKGAQLSDTVKSLMNRVKREGNSPAKGQQGDVYTPPVKTAQVPDVEQNLESSQPVQPAAAAEVANV